MKTYIKFIFASFLKSFLFIFIITFCLIFILNLLSEIDFFKEIKVNYYFPIFLSFLNSPSLLFEIFPFIILLSAQLFFVNIFKENQIEIFKYSGLKNFDLIKIISILTLLIGLITIIFYYNFSSNLKNFYLSLKSKYTTDDKYLAVITNNGLWIKDRINEKIFIINALEVSDNFLNDAFISEFDNNFNLIRNIKSDLINIESKKWIIYDAIIFEGNQKNTQKILELNSNFDYQQIQNLFSNLSSLSIMDLFKLKKNYNRLGYSTTEIDIHLMKITVFPFYLVLMVIFSSILMLSFKHIKNNTFKISMGLFFSVIIYYINNFFYVMGSTERISLILAIMSPIMILSLVNLIMLNNINEK